MPGAGGVRATNFLANVAEKDGTAFAILNRGVIYAGILGSEGVQFQSEKLNWLGSASREISVCAVMHGSPVATIQDALTKEAIIGGTSPNDDTVTLTAIMNNLTGTKFRIVTGYKSGTEVNIAMERGEVHGRCGWSWTSLQSQRPQWVTDKTIDILVSQWFEPHPAFPDVPLAIDMVKSPEDRKVMEFILARQVMGRPFVAPSGMPPERVALMRQAFMETMKDPKFAADMEKQKFDLDPVPGEELQKIIANLAAVPKDLASRAEQALLAKPESMKTAQ
jgi:tripartite-type tricarboxylate transporter receptor subunit TctC